jgi:hypothetical protein
VIRLAIQQNKEQVLDMEDRQQANRLRGQFYAYVGVLKKAAQMIMVQGELRQIDSKEEQILELALMSSKLMISVEDAPSGGVLVRFTNREQSWQAQAIARIRTVGEIPPAKRLLEDGSVMPENELAELNNLVMALKYNWPIAETSLAAMRKDNPHWWDHSGDLREAIAQWEAERSLTHKPLTDTEQRVQDRLTSYGFDPKKGGAL